ncbi:J domain-containing protein [Aquisphaera insulae]|uniref:J domain-containing protein n=1 Tax=Aquisphaera insulae TaxID=2712864 RepID=UPI00196B7D76|nr:J domain-containing protein [Aquisphaera insulae]
MATEQDGRVIWVVVELHRKKRRIRSRIVQHLGEYRDRDEAEAAYLDRIASDPRLREIVDRWAAGAADVLSDRKARRQFLLYGALTGGVSAYSDELLRGRAREEDQARARALAASWSPGGPLAAFSLLGLLPIAGLDEIKAAYRNKARVLHPDRGGDHQAMVELNAAYESAVAYAAWRG